MTIAQLDARLVGALGLCEGREHVHEERARSPASRSRPASAPRSSPACSASASTTRRADDSLELLPNDPATRAEAAYSVAQILQFDGWEVDARPDASPTRSSCPSSRDWQTQILDTAVARIGMPYIWGGTSDGPETEFGVSSRGGYDCSGFVWRVYKLQPYAGEGTLASVLRGRTTYQMSGEVPRSQRIGLAKLEPADVIFFGDQRPALAAGAGRPHGDLPRQRLVHPLVRLRRRARAARRLVRAGVRVGAAAARRGRASTAGPSLHSRDNRD